MTEPLPPAEPMKRLEPYHAELTRYAARMLGSRFEAEDAVQDTMVRAWSALDRFDGRSHLRTWLYRICTNVCLDMLASRQRRARPIDLLAARLAVEASQTDTATATPTDNDPAELAVARESVHQALITVLQHLPPRQRAVLILCEVLHWSATEVADLLHTSVASVNSALQRARSTLRARRIAGTTTGGLEEVDAQTRSRLGRYVRALDSSDMEALTKLLVQEAA